MFCSVLFYSYMFRIVMEAYKLINCMWANCLIRSEIAKNNTQVFKRNVFLFVRN